MNKKYLQLPYREFFYTPDQVAAMLEVQEPYLMNNMLHFSGVSPGKRPMNKIQAVDITPDAEVPKWRIPESSLKAFLRYRGVRITDRGYV